VEGRDGVEGDERASLDDVAAGLGNVVPGPGITIGGS